MTQKNQLNDSSSHLGPILATQAHKTSPVLQVFLSLYSCCPCIFDNKLHLKLRPAAEHCENAHAGLGTFAVGKRRCSPEEERQMDKRVRYEEGQIWFVWLRKEKTGRHMTMIFPPIKTCCRADNDELCSPSARSCNLICSTGDLDMILEMPSNLKRKGWKRLDIYSTASFMASSFQNRLVSPPPDPVPTSRQLLLFVPSRPGLIHKINKNRKSSSIEQHNSFPSFQMSNSASSHYCTGCLSSISTCLLALTKVRLVLPSKDDTFLGGTCIKHRLLLG